MPRLAFNRKDRGGHSIGIEASMTANFTSRFNPPASKRFQCGGIVANGRGGVPPPSRKIGHIAS
jgi:hypothetical protein